MSMNKQDEFDRRMLRLDGLKPTARDRWKAFHRLYRISQGHGPYQDMAAVDCFRVLYSDWRPMQLLDGSKSDGMVDRSHMPKFLRKRLIESHRKRRLYAGHYEWMELDKTTANKVRDKHGIEVTPTEVAEVRRKIIRLAREQAAKQDIKVPDDDEALLRLLKGKS